MSYSICRIEKTKMAGVTGVQIHDRREKGVSHTNKDIDWSRTHENVELTGHTKAFRTIVKNRIDELDLKRGVRKDATVMSQAMITSDDKFFKGMTKDQQLEFFNKSYDFIKDRYGEKNMVSATIHFDEKTPHMHVNFVPVTEDGRLSARDLFSPGKLRKFQDDFNKHCKDNGYDLERGKLDSKRKHLSVEEYKIETKFIELKNQEIEIDEKMEYLKNERKSLENDLKSIDGVKADFDTINAIEGKNGALIGKGYVKVKVEDFEHLKDIAKRQHVIERKNEFLERENKSLRQDLNKVSDKTLDKNRQSMEQESKLRGMTKELDSVRDYLTVNNKLDDYREFRDQQKKLAKQQIQTIER